MIPRKLYALDTGAVKGGYLTAVILPEYRIVQIKSKRNYYEASRLEWSQIKFDKQLPEKLPIHIYFAIKKKVKRNEFEEKAVARFEKYLSSLQIQKKAEYLKEKFTRICGELPSAGPERGKYFLSIKHKLPFANHRLAGMVLSSKAFKIAQFLKLFEGKNLLIAMQELEKIEDGLKFIETVR